MFSLLFTSFSRERCERAIGVGIAATIVLIMLVILVAEPLRVFDVPQGDTLFDSL